MSGVHSGTIDVARVVGDDLSFVEVEAAEDGTAVLIDESLSFSVCELANCVCEAVSILWISVQVNGTPVDSSVGVFSLGDVPV